MSREIKRGENLPSQSERIMSELSANRGDFHIEIVGQQTPRFRRERLRDLESIDIFVAPASWIDSSDPFIYIVNLQGLLTTIRNHFGQIGIRPAKVVNFEPSKADKKSLLLGKLYYSEQTGSSMQRRTSIDGVNAQRSGVGIGISNTDVNISKEKETVIHIFPDREFVELGLEYQTARLQGKLSEDKKLDPVLFEFNPKKIDKIKRRLRKAVGK